MLCTGVGRSYAMHRRKGSSDFINDSGICSKSRRGHMLLLQGVVLTAVAAGCHWQLAGSAC
jgi:hypothetical protein